MKLYDVPRGMRVVVRDNHGNEIRLVFDHIAGAIAMCLLGNGTPVGISAWTEVELDKE